MTNLPADADLDKLLVGLEVEFTRLSRSVFGPGQPRVDLAADRPGILYVLSGAGRMLFGKQQVVPLTPHTLVITPRARAEKREILTDGPDIMGFAGEFDAAYGGSIDLFAKLPGPLIERFQSTDRIAMRLEDACDEMGTRQLGWQSVTSSLLKQVLIATLRRSLAASNPWIESFPLLADQRIVRAFADMIAKPGAPHSVDTLASSCGLGRSAFTVRFTHALGSSPMTVLRQIRMWQARKLLASRALSVDQVAGVVGYSNRYSFFRALRRSGTEASGG